jgi:NADPH:quinone reductase-like Zn-dependent oxidoreductase/non-ribosomal peptide synthetase component F/acyl carrier protein
VASEQENLRCTTVDLDPAEDGLLALWAELVADGPEPEIALRGGRRFVSRLERVEPGALPPLRRPAGDPAIASFKLTMPAAGVLDTMRLVERPRPEPGPGELLLAVEAVALNFRDVMAASGLLPEEAEPDPAHEALGTECAGTVLAVGPGVLGFRPGERVATMARGCFAAHATVPAAMVMRAPAGLSAAAAATVPVGFLTAWYALVTLGRMQPGERVLIHVATGGVGLAAIQIAKMIGAEIFATAGSEAKRAFLRELGIRHVMNSRTLDFADEILAATGGAGVDLVLNSLPGPFLEKSLAVLAPHGRFLELGKRDIYGDTPLGLKALRRNVAFFAIDLANVDPRRAATVRAALDELEGHLAAGRIAPLPFERFPASRVVDAFRHMAQAKHIGKVVVELDDPALEVALDPDRPLRLRADASYLVTGGLGGFGLEVARHLARAGAGHLVLMGRSGASSEAARALLAELEAAGTQVTVAQADVTRPEEVRAVVEAIAASGRPLKGVVHGAMVLDDGFLTQLDPVRFARALAPKLAGAWNLHQATRELPLDHFVMFSSVAAMLGSKGQANYVAGNGFLDALALHRRALGLPALTINWGALGEAGFVARTEAMARYLESSGIALVPLAQSLGALDRLLRTDPGAVGFAAIDWDVLARASGGGSASPRFAHLVSAVESGGGRLRAELLAAPAERRPAMVARFLRQQIVKVLRVEESRIEAERPLADVGLDSLTAFELKNRIEGELALSLPVAKLLQQPTLASLGAAVLERLGAEETPAEAAAATPAAAEAAGGAAAATPAAEPSPLSVRQERLLRELDAAPELGPELRDFMLAHAFEIRPGLDLERLRAAFDAVVARHAMLRASFPRVDGRRTLHIAEVHPRGLEVVEARGLDEAGLRAAVQAVADQPEDLDAGPLFRILLFRADGERDVVLLRVHHTVIDDWSAKLVLEELFGRYFGLPVEEPTADAPSHADFVRFQRELLASPEGARHRAFWEEELAGIGEPLPLPYDRPRRPGPVRAAGRLELVLDEALTARIHELARATGTTPHAVLHAGFDALLHGLTGETDLPVDGVGFGRTRPEFRHLVGWLSTRITVRTRIQPERPFAELVRTVAQELALALEHQDYPVPLVADGLRAAAGGRPSRLGQVDFYMRRAEQFDTRGFGGLVNGVGAARIDFRGHAVAVHPVEPRGIWGDLDIGEAESQGRVQFEVRYNADAFERATVERILERYRRLLERAVEAPELQVAALAADLAVPGPAAAAAAAAVTEDLPLSANEARLLDRIDRLGVRDAYTRHFEYACAFAIRPPLDRGRLAAALATTLERHDILRTVYPREAGRRVPRVLARHPTGLEVVEPGDRSAAEIEALVQARAEQPHDVERGPLFEAILYRARGEDLLLLRLHHLVYDGWSLMLLLNELFERYFGLRGAEPRPAFQCRDAVRWQRAYMESAEGRAELAWWKAELADPGPPLELPFLRGRAGATIAHGRTVRFVIEEATTRRLLELAAARRCSSYAVLHAAMKALLWAWTGRSDLLVDASVAARVRPELEPVVGWLNTVRAIRNRVAPERGFATLVDAVAEAVRGALAHQAHPWLPLLRRLGLDPAVRPSPLGQVALMAMRPDNIDDRGLGALLVDRPDARVAFGSIEVRAVPLAWDHCERDLQIFVQELGGRVWGEVVVDAERCTAADTARLARDYTALLEAAVAAPEVPLEELIGGLGLGFGPPPAARFRAAE